MTQGIQPYYGEFLVSPIPLELSLIEPCDYACAYCFAILGDRHQSAKSGKPIQSNATKQAYKLISDFKNRDTLAATLLKMGYPILMSNRTDPFGRTNRGASVPLIEVCTELEIPIAFQTKGFVDSDDLKRVLEVAKPSCWYISIAFCDDDLRAKIEPGAPTLQHRLDLVSTLVEAGHSVVVGINPCVPEWFDKPHEMIAEFKQRGASGCWVERLHFSHWDEKQMKPREKAAITQEIIDRAKKKKTPQVDMDHFHKVRAIAQENGLEVFSVGQGNRSDFWDAYRKHYPLTFPTNQDFINLCHDADLKDGTLITFDEYAEFMLPFLPEGVLQVGHYVGSIAHQVCREHPNWTNKFTYDELLLMLWCDSRISMSPANCQPLSYAAFGDKEVIDELETPIMVWGAKGFSELYIQVELEAA